MLRAPFLGIRYKMYKIAEAKLDNAEAQSLGKSLILYIYIKNIMPIISTRDLSSEILMYGFIDLGFKNI